MSSGMSGEDIERTTGKFAKDAANAAGKAKAKAGEAYDAMKQMGYFEHIGEFCKELVRPFKEVEDVSIAHARQEIVATLKFKPTEPEVGFNLWNVAAFYLGVLESLVGLAFGRGAISLIWNLLIGFIVAYTLYWGMLCKKTKKAMFWMLALLLAYGAFCGFQVVLNVVFIFSAIVYAVKFVCTLLMLINGAVLYRRQAGDSLLGGESK